MKTKLSMLCDKIIEAGWLIAVVSVPVFFNIYTARTFEPDKITLLRSFVCVMVLAWLISTIERGFLNLGESSEPLSVRFKEWLKIPFVAPTLLLSIAYIISTMLSLAPSVSFWGSYQRLQGAYTMLSYITVFALIATHLREREQIDRLVTIIIITSVPVSLYGIVQKYGLDPLPWAGDVTSRVASTLGNAIFVASYIIMAMPLTMSRLVESMTAIIKEEKASWGHTILAAIYIFILAIQSLTVIFSGSRGPMLGILGSSFVMGLLYLMTLRQNDPDKTALSPNEILLGLAFIVPLGLTTALGAGIGLAMGLGLNKSLVAQGYDIGQVTIVGIAVGGLLGLLGLYVYMASTNRGWRWLWLSWLWLAVSGITFLLLLNVRGTPLDPYMNPIRQLPGFSNLSTITQTEGGTGEVRLFIWNAAMELVKPHEPMGIPGDPDAPADMFNAVRPLFGYGPESMFNAFAFSYPPGLAHVEARGSSADRSHNETMDSWVITGFVGFVAYYYIMVSVFLYGLFWLGWTPTPTAKRAMTAFMLLSATAGGLIAYFAVERMSFVPLGLPFGLIAGFLLYLIWRGLITIQPRQDSDNSILAQNHLLLIGLLGAVLGHFIEVHFVFSIAATYTYFWVYRGLMLAIDRMEINRIAETEQSETTEVDSEEISAEAGKQSPTRRGRGHRRGIDTGESSSRFRKAFQSAGINWELVVAGYGLTLAIIMIIMTFDFITPQFEWSPSDERARQGAMALGWMYGITWVIGFGITMADIVIRQEEWRTKISWPRAIGLYAVSSLSYFFFYYVMHGFQFGQQVGVATPQDAITAANVLVNGLLTLYVFLILLMILFAVILSWQRMKRLQFWRSENWWLYPAVAVPIIILIWWKNFDVVKADIYLKEGERYRNASQWEHAIALHKAARDLDADEDFYYLMLALDYQLKAQDGNLDINTRAEAQATGEQTALEARRINPYNPDNTGNMGRYYFTLSQVTPSPEERQRRLEQTNEFFEKAVQLAPTNVVYHNLWAQTAYVEQDFDTSIERLKHSAEIDERYSPTWVLLGDSYAAKGDIDNALMAHTKGMQPNYGSRDGHGFPHFADHSIDLRMNYYISAGRLDDIIVSMQEVALQLPSDPLIPETIANALFRAGRAEEALPYYERSVTLRTAVKTQPSGAVLRNMGATYLNMSNFDGAEKNYKQVVDSNPNDAEARNALAYIYAQQKRYDEAIAQHQHILQQNPEDYSSLQNLSVLYNEMGRLREAIEFAQRALAVAPETEKPNWQQFIANLEAMLAQEETGL